MVYCPSNLSQAQEGDSIRQLIGVDKSIKYVALSDFLRNDGSYILEPYLEDAYKAQVPNAFQKEFKDVDQKVNLLYNTLGGRNLRIFPVPDDENNKWISVADYQSPTKLKSTIHFMVLLLKIALNITYQKFIIQNHLEIIRHLKAY